MIEEVLMTSKNSSGKVLMNIGVTIAITIAVVFNLLFWDMRLGPGEFSAILVVLEINAIFLPLTFIIVSIVKGMQKSKLSASKLRIFGHAAFGKSYDVPLDEVTSVDKSALKGLKVTTSNGIIKLKLISNATELCSSLCKLLNERQGLPEGSLQT